MDSNSIRINLLPGKRKNKKTKSIFVTIGIIAIITVMSSVGMFFIYSNLALACHGAITIIKKTDPSGDAQQFSFTSNVSGYNNFSLADGQNKQINYTTDGSYTITESSIAGWELTSIDCQTSFLYTVDLANRKVKIFVTGDGSATCTFNNKKVPFCGDGIKNGAEECDGMEGVGKNETCSKDCTIIKNNECAENGFDFYIAKWEWSCSKYLAAGDANGTYVTGNSSTANWSASSSVAGVISKEGTNYHLHPGGTNGIITKTDVYAISHLTFCGNNPKCGNKILEAGEECDDGNTADNDGCSSTCTTEHSGPSCGDGAVNQSSEECDDGNTNDLDECRNSCKLPYCGDGFLSNGEYCDDGNKTNNDGCSDLCTVEAPKCGNGRIETGETCDDGNRIDNDGCNSMCQLEPLTIKAYKVVCNNETDLPNWGISSYPGKPTKITANTASDYVGLSNGKCHLETNWSFQWGFDGAAGKQNGAFVGPAGSGWNDFDSQTSNNGVTPAMVAINDFQGNSKLWVRENLKDGYIPFASPDGDLQASTSAEIYCHEDILNFDNYEYINNISLGQTYYCVAFNVLKPVLPKCGDGVVNQTGEECDDGNTANGDGCSSTCTTEHNGHYCGDGTLNAGEECDDGNTNNNDQCKNDCTLPNICEFDLDVMMVMDRSGSMGYDYPTRISLAKTAVNGFLGDLKSGDQSGLVSFAKTASLDKQLSNNHTQTQVAVSTLFPNGATNIGDAIALANGELTSARINASATQVMILVTDGRANYPNGTGYGEYPADVTYALDKANEAAAAGIKIFTIGLGTDINADMLQQIASTTGGKYYYAPTAGDLDDIFTLVRPGVCEESYCGDGAVNQSSEQCDDGNNKDGDGCNATCQPEIGSLTICKYKDLNKNSAYDIGADTPLAWNMKVTYPSGATSTIRTSQETGCYTASSLPYGAYQVEEEMLSGWIRSYPNDNPITTTINAANKDQNVIFLNYEQPVVPKYGSIRVCKLIDDDGLASTTDDQYAATSSSWSFALTTSTGTTTKSTSDGNNCVLFDQLSAGTYHVNEVEKNGWQLIDPVVNNVEVNLGTEENKVLTFVNSVIVVPKSSISGYKYNDANNNGVIDDGEVKMSDWTIQLIRCPYAPLGTSTIQYLPNSRWNAVSTGTEPVAGQCTVVATTTTDSAGYYEFTNLEEGDYGVSEVITASGWTQTYPADNTFYYFNLPASTNKTNINFANYKPGDVVTKSTISGYKYNDANNNGVIDDGEGKMSNWTIQLIGCPYAPLGTSTIQYLPNGRWNTVSTGTEPVAGQCSVIATTTTDSTGYYEFTNLNGGDYGVSEVITTSGWTQTYPANNTFYYFNLPSSSARTNINFANYKPGDVVNPRCGDGIINQTSERCDDGNNISGDGCSATCTTEGGGGGGGGYIETFNVYDTVAKQEDCGVVITWRTNYSATSRIYYDTKPHSTSTLPSADYAYATIEDVSKVTGHNVKIVDLKPGVTYYFRAYSESSSAKYGQEVAYKVSDTCGTVVKGEEGKPVLSITKAVNTEFANPGQKGIEYLITVANKGNLTAYNVKLKDLLPKGLAYTDVKGDNRSWDLGDMKPGDSKAVIYKVNVDDDARAMIYTNTATAVASNANSVKATEDLEVRSIKVLAITGFSIAELVVMLGTLIGLVGLSIFLRKKIALE